MKLGVLKQIIVELAAEFTELRADIEIYLTPRVQSLPSASPLEIQVCEGGAEYIDHDGNVRREQFVVQIGILQKVALDSGGRHARGLTDTTRSVFKHKERVAETLDGSFLEVAGIPLLTRPLIIVRESEVAAGTEDTVNVKILTFTGGLNILWDRISGKWK